MAMILCKQCRKSYNQNAVSCPSCGAPNHFKPRSTRQNAPELKTWHKWGFAVIVPLWIFTMFFYEDDQPSRGTSFQQIDHEKQLRQSKAAAAVIVLKMQMRDPESFRTNMVLTNSTGSTVCIQYQAKNGFGGMNQEEAIFVNGTIKTNWAQWCNTADIHNLSDFSH